MKLKHILITIAIIMTAMGGISDITGKKFFLSKQHLWNDALFILILATLIKD